MHFKGSDKEVNEIGRDLAVDYVVEGSVREAGDRIVLNAQLIQASDQTHLWANRYDAELRDIFSIENAVAEAIAARIGITSNRAARKPTEDLDAYNLYIQGRYLLEKAGSPEAYSQARHASSKRLRETRGSPWRTIPSANSTGIWVSAALSRPRRLSPPEFFTCFGRSRSTTHWPKRTLC